jgi:hypothetical protein
MPAPPSPFFLAPALVSLLLLPLSSRAAASPLPAVPHDETSSRSQVAQTDGDSEQEEPGGPQDGGEEGEEPAAEDSDSDDAEDTEDGEESSQGPSGSIRDMLDGMDLENMSQEEIRAAIAASTYKPPVAYTFAVGGGVSLGTGDVFDSATTGSLQVLLNFAVEAGRRVQVMGGIGYMARFSGSLVDNSPEGTTLDTDIGQRNYLSFEAGARILANPDSALPFEITPGLGVNFEVGRRDVPVWVERAEGLGFHDELIPYFMLDLAQPLVQGESVGLVLGLRYQQDLTPSWRVTGNVTQNLFMEPGSGDRANGWYSNLGLWLGLRF